MDYSKSRKMSACAAVIFFALAAGCFLCPATVRAGIASAGCMAQGLTLSAGKSEMITSDRSVTRISIADPDTADFILISPREIYVTGKEIGTTNMTLWSGKTVLAVYNIAVTHDVDQLQADIRAVLPGEDDVRVLGSGKSITLHGSVTSTDSLSKVVALSEAHAGKKGTVHNLLQVAGNHQVMLEVRVAEVSRTLGRELGINIFYNRGDSSFGVGMLDQLTKLVDPDDANIGVGPLGFLVSDRVNAMFRFSKGSATWSGFIDALSDDGLVKVLAEPNLIALSGQQASFLAGGEFPVPVPQGLGTAAIEWKTYGVLLNFKPVVVGGSRINITVEPTVSEPDASLQVVLNGSFIPALKTRTARTVVELEDGQSFAIAGLLSNNTRSSVAKYPFLGDIPVLGALFTSRAYQRNETELVIVVTPRLVKPFNQQEQPLALPTDYYQEPTDLEFFLWGKSEARVSGAMLASGELDGEYGHAVPAVETMEIDEIEVIEE